MESGKGNQSVVKLSFEERQLLLQRFMLSDGLRAQLSKPTANSIHVWMSTDEAEGIREQAGELFQRWGLSDDMSATQTGAMLDQLIDKFFTG